MFDLWLHLRLGGEFNLEDVQEPPLERIYPRGPSLEPPPHTVSGKPVPDAVAKAYREAWFLRRAAPGAFAGQMRRALEVICKDCGAVGSDLYRKLQHMSESGVFPSGLAEIATLIRYAGNIASHADEREITKAEAELIDALFRMIVEYVYVGPARLRRLRERLLAETEHSNERL
jgi:hypothetical protein